MNLLQTKTKINTFDDVRNYLRNIPHINHGGCGFAALIMYKWLEKHEGIKPTIVYLYREYLKSIYESNDKILIGKADIETVDACAHACIIYKDQYIDCEKIVNISSYEYIHHIKDIDFINASVDADEWSSAFNRKKYIPKVKKELKIRLSIKN